MAVSSFSFVKQRVPWRPRLQGWNRIPLLSAAPIIAGRIEGAVTPRLELRPIDEGVTEALAAVFAKPEVWMFPFGRGLSRP